MSFLTALVTSKVAASALAAGTLVAGGAAGAAYTGSLPTSLQEAAHSLFGAPAPAASAAADGQETAAAATSAAADAAEDALESTKAERPEDSGASAAEGPDATGPAAFGLCQSFAHGGLDASSVGFASLAVAAEGESNITDYCAAIPSPAESANHRADAAGAALENVPAAAQLPAQAVVRAAPDLPAQTVVRAAPELPSRAVVPVAPQLPSRAVVPVAPQLPSQAVVPAASQEAPAGPADKPAPAGRP